MNRVPALTGGLLALAMSGGALHAQGRPAADAAAMFKAWDKNGDGLLSQHEFLAGWQHAQAEVRVQANLRRQFASLDGNHDQAIDAAEYAEMLLVKRAGKTAPGLARFDVNGDGKLAFSEYLRAVAALSARQSGGKVTQ